MATDAECSLVSDGIKYDIDNINSVTDHDFGTEVSRRVGEWLTNHMNEGFGYINKEISFLKDHCGYNQDDINSLGTYNPQITDSLALYGTEATKIPELGDIAPLILKIGIFCSIIFGTYAARNLMHKKLL